jgi:hypothetical protein
MPESSGPLLAGLFDDVPGLGFEFAGLLVLAVSAGLIVSLELAEQSSESIPAIGALPKHVISVSEPSSFDFDLLEPHALAAAIMHAAATSDHSPRDCLVIP